MKYMIEPCNVIWALYPLDPEIEVENKMKKKSEISI